MLCYCLKSRKNPESKKTRVEKKKKKKVEEQCFHQTALVLVVKNQDLLKNKKLEYY